MVANAGKIAIIANMIEPGSVMRDMTVSMNSAVGLPGLTPGMKPFILFISSAIRSGLMIKAV